MNVSASNIYNHPNQNQILFSIIRRPRCTLMFTLMVEWIKKWRKLLFTMKNGKILMTWNIAIKLLQVQSKGQYHWFDCKSVVTDTKWNILNILHPMYITYVSYSTQDLLRVHVLNIYHHQNSWMRSHSSRGLIMKKCNYFLSVLENDRKVYTLG